MKPGKSKKPAAKPAAFKRDHPDLPSGFDCPLAPEELFDDREIVVVEGQCLQDLALPNLKIGTVRIEGSQLERVQFAGGKFASLVWKDVRLAGCDLANLHAHRVTFVRVELIDCRLTGFRATDLQCQDVLLQDCDLRYAQMQRATFKTCEFDHCNFQEADLQQSDLAGSILRACNLARADLRRARLQNTDFRGSEVDSMLVEIADLSRAIVDPVQAMSFARLLGLQIL